MESRLLLKSSRESSHFPPQQLLFQTFDLTKFRNRRQPDAETNAILLFHTLIINSSPHLAPYIRNLTISGGALANRTASPRIANILKVLRNLESFNIARSKCEWAHLSDEIQTALFIYVFPRVKTLDLFLLHGASLGLLPERLGMLTISPYLSRTPESPVRLTGLCVSTFRVWLDPGEPVDAVALASNLQRLREIRSFRLVLEELENKLPIFRVLMQLAQETRVAKFQINFGRNAHSRTDDVEGWTMRWRPTFNKLVRLPHLEDLQLGAKGASTNLTVMSRIIDLVYECRTSTAIQQFCLRIKDAGIPVRGDWERMAVSLGEMSALKSVQIILSLGRKSSTPPVGVWLRTQKNLSPDRLDKYHWSKTIRTAFESLTSKGIKLYVTFE
ncbi:hypothetical protein DL96DRAFT_1778228 [Flagelloscypha sp. PMI_526]|nr:hypothetical protein DL96DRAFT_1778228 [Flagelloscypha sp. PMI_526]